MAKKVCSRLRDSACWRSGEITQPRTNSFGQSCTTNLPNNPVNPVVEEAEQYEGNDPLDEEPRPVDVEEHVVLGQSQIGGRREGLVDDAAALGVVQRVHYEFHLEELGDVEHDGEHAHGNNVVGDAAHRTVEGGVGNRNWNKLPCDREGCQFTG